MTHDAYNDKLIRMANQIGTFFESMPDRTEALAGVAGHLKKFWDPNMRRALLALADDDGAQRIRPIVRDAVNAHRAMIV